MEPMEWLAIGQAALGGIKSIFGASKASQAKKQLNALQRPMMQIPAEASAALANAQKMALMTTLPGQDIMQNNIGSNTQANVNALGEVATGGSLLEGTNRAYQQGAKQISDLDVAAAQFNAANQGAYRQELGQMTNLKNQQFQVNQLDPYNQKYQELTNQRSAGQSNMWGGIGMAAQAAGSYLGMKQESDQFNQMMGTGNYAPNPNRGVTGMQVSPMSPVQTNSLPMNFSQNPLMDSRNINSMQQKMYSPWNNYNPFKTQ
jgi:hypothetical protein